MVTLTIDEATLNATRAALDERVKRLQTEVARYAREIPLYGAAYAEDSQRALVWNVAALLETETAREFYAEVEVAEDHPEDETWTNREGMPEFNGAFR